MDYKLASEILDSFYLKYRDLNFERELIKTSIQFATADGKEYVIILEVENIKSIKTIRNLVKEKFTFKNKENELILDIIIQEGGPIYAYGVLAGSPMRHNKLLGFGTYGWGILINGKPIALSNWHVLCPYGNSTRIGDRVLIDNQNIAFLKSFEIVSEFGTNIWDMAFAQFDNFSDMIESYRQCEDGLKRPYPEKIQTKELTLGTKSYKVGARSPICQEGYFHGVSNIQVRYSDNSIKTFIKQLEFTKMSNPGDSGSIIVNANTNEVIGLNFAGNDKYSYANPINTYDKLTFVGTKYFEPGISIPMYESFDPMFDNIYQVNEMSNFPSGTNIPNGIITYEVFDRINGFWHGIKIESLIDKKGDWMKVKIRKDGLLIDEFGWINTNYPNMLYIANS